MEAETQKAAAASPLGDMKQPAEGGPPADKEPRLVIDRAGRPRRAARSKPHPADRDAVIFIPGLMARIDNRPVEDVARRVAAAMNRNARTPEAAFVTGEGRNETFEGSQTRVVTISRRDGDRLTPVVDMYMLDYISALTGPYRGRNQLSQALTIALGLLGNMGRMLRSLRSRSKTTVEKIQIIYAGLIFLFLAVYLLLMLFTVAVTVVDALATYPGINLGFLADIRAILTAGTSAGAASSAAGEAALENVKITPAWLHYLQVFVLVVTSLGLFTRFDLRAVMDSVSAEMSSSINYLSLGERGGAVAGQFSALLEHILEKAPQGVRYRHVNVMSFSFGSIVAIDSLFPIHPPGERISRIGTLVTIGCPFDFIRAYWDHYFEGRCMLPSTPNRWINVYAEADVLGSNFKDEEKRAAPEPGSTTQPNRGVGNKDGGERKPDVCARFGPPRRLEQYSLFERLALVGFRSHGGYWERDTVTAIDCFDLVVRQLYTGDPLLA